MPCAEIAYQLFESENMLTPEEKQDSRELKDAAEEIMHANGLNPTELSKEQLAKLLHHIRNLMLAKRKTKLIIAA
jgi:hypothetical protein